MWKSWKITETLAYGYYYECTPWGLSDEYQYDWVKMVFKNLCVLVHWMKVALPLKGLNIVEPFSCTTVRNGLEYTASMCDCIRAQSCELPLPSFLPIFGRHYSAGKCIPRNLQLLEVGWNGFYARKGQITCQSHYKTSLKCAGKSLHFCRCVTSEHVCK